MTPRGIGYLIKMINDKIKVKADADLKSHDLTLAQSRVLAFLNSRDGQATQKEIEDYLGVSHPTVVGIVSRMEQNGHVTTLFDNRQRSKTVRLTAKARAIGEGMELMIREQEATMLRGLTEQQVAELFELLLAVYHNLQ